MQTPESIAAYRAALAGFDWHYQMSDDRRKWAAGEGRLAVIRAMQEELDPDGSIWREYQPKAIGCPGPMPAVRLVAPKFGAFKPSHMRRRHGGIALVYRFSNGYGASVTRHRYSRGAPMLWELAVIRLTGEGPMEWEPHLVKPTCGSPVGHLTESGVEHLLKVIESMPSRQQEAA